MLDVLSQVASNNNALKIALAGMYVDSIELFSTRKFRPAFVRAIQANSGSAWPKAIRDEKEKGTIWGYRLIVNQPSRYCIGLLQLYAQIDPKLSLYLLHVPLDVFVIYEGWTRDEVIDTLKNLIHLRYRRATDELYNEHDASDAVQSIRVTGRKTRPYRNTAFYRDLPSKITGEAEALHFEIRLERKRSVQAAGIFQPIDILAIKPTEIFNQFCVVKDHREKLEETTRRGINLTCKKYADLLPSYVEKRVRALNRRIGLHHVSIFAKHYPDRFDRLEKRDCLDIEPDLNWASADVACDEEVRELHSLSPPQKTIKPSRPLIRERL